LVELTMSAAHVHHGRVREYGRGQSGAARVAQTEDVLRAADAQCVAVAKAGRAGNALAVEVSAVAAAEVDQPVFLFTLKLDERVPARHGLIVYGNMIGCRSAERA
jgi:hypothetical protein